MREPISSLFIQRIRTVQLGTIAFLQSFPPSSLLFRHLPSHLVVLKVGEEGWVKLAAGVGGGETVAVRHLQI